MSDLGKFKERVKSSSKKTPQGEVGHSSKDLSTPFSPKSLERGGPKGPEPTRYGDWERAGRCIDF
ncbi:MAG: hypothetical protein CBC38_05550 [Gammaproteobacteria bacterium TMED78]|nr:MAG: hypothetical protein CBC38_05550 [Gammaproteobacteria bacterium TMED78]|tara:strand:- start:89651 stop:89845 length:195 start_codon:yes stop_codon:yes gene_type:complete